MSSKMLFLVTKNEKKKQKKRKTKEIMAGFLALLAIFLIYKQK
ncbi:hypothetical protein DOY81_006373, partial [Sarcophaga bullata]